MEISRADRISLEQAEQNLRKSLERNQDPDKAKIIHAELSSNLRKQGKDPEVYLADIPFGAIWNVKFREWRTKTDYSKGWDSAESAKVTRRTPTDEEHQAGFFKGISDEDHNRKLAESRTTYEPINFDKIKQMMADDERKEAERMERIAVGDYSNPPALPPPPDPAILKAMREEQEERRKAKEEMDAWHKGQQDNSEKQLASLTPQQRANLGMK